MLIACGGGSAGGRSTPAAADDEGAVRDVIERQLALYQQQDFDAMYETYSPSFRQQCTRQQLEDSIRSTGANPNLIEFKDIRIVVDGDTARATFVSTYDGAPLETISDSEPDLYVKVDGTWYDELDRHTHC